MKHKLYRRFFLVYLLIGILGLFITALGGSFLVEKHLKELVATSLKKGAQQIASEEFLREDIPGAPPESIAIYLSSVAAALDADIWIIDENNRVILDSLDPNCHLHPRLLKEFDPEDWKDSTYCSGDFYGSFKNPHISVLAPINDGQDGYVAIHYLTTNLYQRRSSIQEIMLMIVTLVYGLSFFMLLIFRKYVNEPLRQIAHGCTEYANGNLAYTIPVNSDDELGYLSQTLNYMAERLNQSGKYQREFISNVSHDFRSPLTSIRGYVGAMLDGTIPPEMQEKYLNVISYETERLEKLTKSLLALNALDSGKRNLHPQSFDINDVLKTTAAVFEGIGTRRKISLKLLLSGTELFVYADKEQIQQVVYNLLDNALKFSGPNSTVTLETTLKNGRVFVSVKDQGEGIPKESIPKIWERFYKTDTSRGRDRKGSGLGLSIVREIINAHGQTINVISTEGVGTEFIFTLEKSK